MNLEIDVNLEDRIVAKVLLPEMIHQAGIQYLEDKGYIIKICGIDEEEIIESIRDCDAIICRNVKISKEVIEAAPNMKVIARHGVGVDCIDIEAAKAKRIWVTNAPESNTNAVAEQTIAALLCGARKLRECDAMVRNGEFSKRNTIRGFELKGKKLGVIGFGRIGRSIASIANKGFGMEICYYDPYITAAENEEYCRMDSIRDVLSIADVVTIHLPLTEDTYHLIGEKEFGYMKKDSFFINYARGPLIDIDALINAIRKHEIGGAALDVFEDETIQKSDTLYSLSEVVLSPHTAAFTEESLKNMALHAAITVDEVLSGKTPRWFVSGI